MSRNKRHKDIFPRCESYSFKMKEGLFVESVSRNTLKNVHLYFIALLKKERDV